MKKLKGKRIRELFSDSLLDQFTMSVAHLHGENMERKLATDHEVFKLLSGNYILIYF